MDKSRKYRVYLPADAEQKMFRISRELRQLHNHLIALNEDCYKSTGKGLGNSLAFERAGREWRDEPGNEWRKQICSSSIIYAAKHVYDAYQRYFDPKQKVRHPTFHSKHGKFTKIHFSSAHLKQDSFKGDWKVQLPGKIICRIRDKSILEGRIIKSSLGYRGGQWHLSVTYEVDDIEPTLPEHDKVGIDMGLRTLATGFNGKDFIEVANPRSYAAAQRLLRVRQKRLSRCTKDSKGYWKAKEQVAKIHLRIANIRNNRAHEKTTDIIRNHQSVVVETLNIKGMMRNRNLAKAVADASMSEFIRQLEYKAKWNGRDFTKTDQWYASTQICNACGHKNTQMKDASIETLVCTECGYTENRDKNAARNLYQQEAAA